MAKVKRFLLQNSLWLVGAGLCLASSGLDGTYMAAWMPGAPWLGYILNTTADVATSVIMYHYGRIQQGPKSRRRKLSKWLLPVEFIAIGYSCFFSWRQLRRVLPQIEGGDAVWVAPVSALFIPILLMGVGMVQAFLAGKEDKPEQANTEQRATISHLLSATEPEKNAAAQPVVVELSELTTSDKKGLLKTMAPTMAVCDYCGKTLKNKHALSAHLRFCDAYKAHKLKQESEGQTHER